MICHLDNKPAISRTFFVLVLATLRNAGKQPNWGDVSEKRDPVMSLGLPPWAPLNWYSSATFIPAGVLVCLFHDSAHYRQADFCLKRKSLFWILICIVCSGVWHIKRPYFKHTAVFNVKPPRNTSPSRSTFDIQVSTEILRSVSLTPVSLFCIKHLSPTSLYKGNPPRQLQVSLFC